MGGSLRLVGLPGPRDRTLGLRAHPWLRQMTLRDRPLDFLGHLEPGVQDVADEQVVEEDADDASDERPHDGYPEVAAEIKTDRVVGAREGDPPPAGDPGEQPGAEVARRVDRVARVRAVGHADRGHGQADGKRRQVGPDRGVPQVDQRDDEDQQERRADDLVDQRPGVAAVEVPGRERGKDRVCRESPAAAPRRLVGDVERVDRVEVHEEHQRGADERADDLGRHVRQDLHPGELAPHRERQRHRRVYVGAAHAAGHPDREGDGHRPSPGDQQPVARGLEDHGGARRPAGPRQAGHGHGDHAVAERYQDERPKELGKQFAPKARNAADGTPLTAES
jgi:hypothetical protein